MRRRRAPKRQAIEREPFVPHSANLQRPLVRIRAAEITTDGSTRLHTSYIEGKLPHDLPTNNTHFIDDEVGYAGDLGFDSGSIMEDIPCDAPLGKRKRFAAVSSFFLFFESWLLSKLKDAPLLAWIPERQDFVDEMMRLNGRGSEGIGCQCGEVSPQFRCCDCFGVQMFCRACTLRNHAYLPLHRVEVCLTL